MTDPSEFERAFQNFIADLPRWLPDGIIEVDLQILQEIGLLTISQLEQSQPDLLDHSFHVLETPDKVTLFNERFVIWIVPQQQDPGSKTLVFIALMQEATDPHLEIVFATEGVYNTPKYIMRILHHYLAEVLDTEAAIDAMGRKRPGA